MRILLTLVILLFSFSIGCSFTGDATKTWIEDNPDERTDQTDGRITDSGDTMTMGDTSALPAPDDRRMMLDSSPRMPTERSNMVAPSRCDSEIENSMRLCGFVQGSALTQYAIKAEAEALERRIAALE